MRVFGLLPLPSADMLRAGGPCPPVKAAFSLWVSKRFQEPNPFRKAAQRVAGLGASGLARASEADGLNGGSEPV